jgi:hypothetical protein
MDILNSILETSLKSKPFPLFGFILFTLCWALSIGAGVQFRFMGALILMYERECSSQGEKNGKADLGNPRMSDLIAFFSFGGTVD